MKLPQHQLVWISVSMLLLLPALRLAAQCDPPGAFWLHSPQTSNALTFNWSAASGATQYQIRFWESIAPGDKTLINDYAVAPFVLDGLKKSTTYTIQIRSVCGGITSQWGAPVNYLTAKSTETCGLPTGVVVTPGAASLSVSWTSAGSHTIRYRYGYTGDWLIPSGAMTVSTSPFVITGLAPGTYQVDIKRNCSTASGNFLRIVKTVQDGCATPAAPTVIPDVTSASVLLPVVNGVSGYNVAYRQGTTGNWLPVGFNIPTSLCYMNPPFAPTTQYQAQIQAVCASGNSSFSAPATFTTLASASCLANKDFGKNLSDTEKSWIDEDFNNPSPYTIGSMIGVNDGGLIFRSFQNDSVNQITQLTTQFRNFHTIDEDFDNSLTDYEHNTKPKDTSPEGTPAYTARNRNLYYLYRHEHGFKDITAAIELLQYGPQSWKDKIYRESDWSAAGPAGIRISFENYTKKFIDAFAPANGKDLQLLTGTYQVGNELWDYPVESDYHNLLLGARGAFVSKYGEKSAGGWKMKLVAGAFQAFRDDNCIAALRDVSNCGGDLGRHDFIGDYLNVLDCNVLKDLDAIDCHPYSFLPGTTNWTYPENRVSDAWQIRNLAGWKDANKNSATGILEHTRLWASEYGFDSNPTTGVGELTQSAYLIRGLLLHSRYHFEKVFIYNAFDHLRTTDANYNSLYQSSGLWRQGTHPRNSEWPSPLIEHGAAPKPAWYGLLDLKARFGDHVFSKALLEDTLSYVFLITKPDGTDPYLVFWSPQQTDDASVHENLAVNKAVNWSAVLPGNYRLGNIVAQEFATSNNPGQTFVAATGADCGAAIIQTARRNPAFIRLVSCSGCPNVLSFKRYSHASPTCNANGDYYYEVVVNNITADDQILIAGLPDNGINAMYSSLNNISFDATTFQANLQYVNAGTLRWQVNAANGNIQTLKLYYCWANGYPEPVSISTATSMCNGVAIPCSAGSNASEPGNGDRNAGQSENETPAFRFTAIPNPGTDKIRVTYFGAPAVQAQLRIVSATGQLMSTQQIVDVGDQQQLIVNVRDLPPGMYFLCLQTAQETRYQIWKKS